MTDSKTKFVPVFATYGENTFYEELNLLNNEKSREKFIKTVERIVRTSVEYREYIKYLKVEALLTQCAVMNKLPEEVSKSISIEMHHCPHTLYDLVEIVLVKHLVLNQSFTRLSIANEVMNYHFVNKVGLVPLTVTVHQLVHSNANLVSKSDIFGDFEGFYRELEKFHSDEQKNKIERFLIQKDSAILDSRKSYLEVNPELYLDFDDSSRDKVKLPKVKKKETKNLSKKSLLNSKLDLSNLED